MLKVGGRAMPVTGKTGGSFGAHIPACVYFKSGQTFADSTVSTFHLSRNGPFRSHSCRTRLYQVGVRL